ncbi:MAG: response regulator transcription factor [Bacteroidetes bacterium]|nr:response regulator transcription factor [Bacteroidota bacterium]
MLGNNIIKVLIADDHKLFRTGIIRILSCYPDIYIADEAENGNELIEKYFIVKPDVILTDISMPLLSGLDAVKRIKEKDISAKVLFLSMYNTTDYIYSCYVTGGSGLINKNIIEEELIVAMRKVYAGERYFGKDFSDEMLNALILKNEAIYMESPIVKKPNLSKRELEVLKLIGDGCTSAEIAETLFVDIRTVDSHRTHIMHKLKLKSLTEFIRYAVQFANEDNS